MSKTQIHIKVCGIRDPENLEQLCTLDPDFVGFIFYPLSKRYVGDHPDPALFRIPGSAVKKVGVFVDEELKQLKRAIERYGLDAVQLHGSETVEYCRELFLESVEVIKVLDPRVPGTVPERFREVADLFLFDSAGAGSGGSGQKFNWKLLEDLPVHVPFLLSGGIGPGDAGLVRSLDLRDLRGVDVNSRFELLPGIKDIKLLKEFFTEIRK
jgi:phosphoribosylanthranilate isomerase